MSLEAASIPVAESDSGYETCLQPSLTSQLASPGGDTLCTASAPVAESDSGYETSLEPPLAFQLASTRGDTLCTLDGQTADSQLIVGESRACGAAQKCHGQATDVVQAGDSQPTEPRHCPLPGDEARAVDSQTGHGEECIDVKIIQVSGAETQLRLPPDCRVGDLKKLLETKHGFPRVKVQKLILKEQILSDEETLDSLHKGGSELVFTFVREVHIEDRLRLEEEDTIKFLKAKGLAHMVRF